MDSFLLKAIAGELKNELFNAIVTNIQSLEEKGILISLRNKGQNKQLLISWNQSLARVHLTGKNWELDQTGTNFSQQLKKYLSGAPLIDIKHPEGERILTLTFGSTLQKKTNNNVTLHFFGSYTNAIFWQDPKTQIIADVKQSYHQSLDPMTFLYPKQSTFTKKNDPFTISADDFLNLRQTQPELTFVKFLLDNFYAIGPETAQEIAHCHQMKQLSEWECFKLAIQQYQDNSWRPAVRFKSVEKIEYESVLPFVLASVDIIKEYQRFQDACDDVYMFHWHKGQIKILKQKLLKNIKPELRKTQKTLAKLQQEKDETRHHEHYKKLGDLILSNLSFIKPRQLELTVTDIFVDNTTEITISLDPALSAVENSQYYYRRSSKLKRRSRVIGERIEELVQKERLLHDKLKTIRDTDDIKTLNNLVHLDKKSNTNFKKSKTPKSSKPSQRRFRRFISSDGWTILIGRNNKENDELTLHEAQTDDFFLHIRDYGGSHVIVKNPGRKESLPAKTLIQAATLAGHYSKARKEPAVDVTITQRKYVRKPKGFPPGKVLIEREKNIRVQMNPDLIHDLFDQMTT